MSSLPPPQSSASKTPAKYTPKPWREFFDTKTLSFPTAVSETLTRLKTNLPYFRNNYGVLSLMIFPLLTFVHHLSIVTFVLMSVFLVAYYRYFTASPIEVFGWTVDDQSVCRILFFADLCCVVFFPSGSITVLAFILVYSVMVCLHGALKAVPDAGENPYDRLLDHHTTGATYNTMESSL
ncbi:PRA1 family protein F2-like [Silene latifolia]|uniref:PRA1 family protein F2-like n=1 Tax=Silene latifolia TaxID=37657 RepID=UPI003D774F97